MTDLPVPSPCVRLCELDDEGYCLGCRRTIAEIVAWPSMSEEEKEAVWGRLREETASGSGTVG
ncbi:MAG: DUF1289 domain-containing protein [Fimbriimonadaceae bacterium]|nr:DUF1289 domain-containing protein [Fimbriimonadaceae bacterium]